MKQIVLVAATVGVIVVIIGGAIALTTNLGNTTSTTNITSTETQNSLSMSSTSTTTSTSFTSVECNQSPSLLISNPPLLYTFSAGSDPENFAFGPSNTTLYFVDSQGTLIETNTSGFAFATISVGTFPYDIVYASKTQSFYVGTLHSLIAINASSNQIYQNLSAAYPTAMAFIPTSSELYVGLAANETLVYNTTNWQLVKTFNDTFIPLSIVYDPTNQLVYVENLTSTLVINPNTNEMVSAIPYVTGNILYDPHVDRIYIASYNGSVFVVDPSTNEELSMFYVNPDIQGLTFDSLNDNIYFVSGYALGEFSDQTNQVMAENATGGSPNYLSRIEYNPSLNLLFATSGESGNAYVFTPFVNGDWLLVNANGCPTTLSTTTITNSTSLLSNQSQTITVSSSTTP
jgi:hypothetical protein